MRCGAERLTHLGLTISTSLVERFNLTLRHALAPLTRKCWGFCKDRQQLRRRVIFFHVYYNFARPHQSLRRPSLTALIELGSAMAEIVKNMNATIVTIVEFDDLLVKTDVLVNVPGLAWTEAWANRVAQSYQGQSFYTVSRADLIKAKRAAGWWQDLEDVKALEATAENDPVGG